MRYRSLCFGADCGSGCARGWLGLVVVSLLLGAAAPAQGQALGEPIPFRKGSGMGRPLFPIGQPRSLTDPRRAARLDYYQQQASRFRRNPFRVGALHDPIAGVQATMARFRSGQPIYPSGQNDALLGAISLEQMEAFRSYGGFGERRKLEARPGDLNEALQRRNDLVEATSLYAPVVRANLENASVAGLRASLELAPLPQLTRPLPESAEIDPPTLVEKFSRRIDSAYERKLEEAWFYFRDGDYRKAVHSFKAAAGLGDESLECELGQLFCNVSMGAPRTAVAVLARIARDHENPFLYELDVAGRYGRRVDVDILKARARFQATATRDNPALLALSTMVFWYLGEVEEARSTVSALRTEGRGTVFAKWPDRLEEAIARRTAGTRAP